METVTISLSFSTRMLGLAVFKSNLLMDYSLKLHKEKFSLSKTELFLSSLQTCFESYTVKHLVLSIPEKHHQTSDFQEILNAIENYTQKKYLQFTCYPIKELYERFGNPVKRTRLGLINRLVLLYPELEVYYHRELSNKNKYYIKLFEAVAAGAYHWVQQEK